MQLPANYIPNYGHTFETTMKTSSCYHSPIAIREETQCSIKQPMGKECLWIGPDGWNMLKPHSYWLNPVTSCELPILDWNPKVCLLESLCSVVWYCSNHSFDIFWGSEILWKLLGKWPQHFPPVDSLLQHLRLLFLTCSFGPQDCTLGDFGSRSHRL